LKKGESHVYNNVKITFDEFNFPPEVREAMMAGKDFEIGVDLSAESNGKKENFKVALISKGGVRNMTSADLKESNVKVTLLNLQATGTVDLALSDLNNSGQNVPKKTKEVLTITASVKPFINFVWTGVLIMVLGFGFSVARRLRESFR
jgi:cytochrome c biogenesis factor